MCAHVRTFRPADFSAMILLCNDLADRAEQAMWPRIAAVVTRFPERELEIHRQYARDPTFREICEDYDKVLKALRHCEEAGPAGAAQGGRLPPDTGRTRG